MQINLSTPSQRVLDMLCDDEFISFLINTGESLEFPKIRDFFIEHLRIQLEKQGASNPISQACFFAGVDDCTYRRRKLASLHYKRAFCTQSDEK